LSCGEQNAEWFGESACRLDEANDQTIKYQTEMKTHKQNAVQLEKLIGKMKLETNSKSTSGE